jgi:hypothetical protein
MPATNPDAIQPKTIRRGRVARVTAFAGGLLLVLLAVQPVLAVSWGGQVRLSTESVFRPEILRTGPSRAIALWQVGTQIKARRTIDGGKTWTPPVTVTSGINLNFSASSLGSKVDLTYTKQVKNSDGFVSIRLYYKRSEDAGATWQTARRLTSTTSRVMDQDVSRGPNGRVSVVWTGYTSGNLYTRSSTNDGDTFGSAKFVGHTTNWEPGRTITYRSDPKIAIGSGVMYVAYTSASDTLAVRRSTNLGSSWSSAKILSTHATDRPSMVASGGKAVIGYTSTATGAMKAIIRRTTDSGAHWTDSKTITSHGTGEFSTRPQFAYRDGVLAVTFKAGTPGAAPVWHKTSTDWSASWTATRTKVSLVNDSTYEPEPAGVAILDTGHLAGVAEYGRDTDDGFWIRRSN